MLVMLYPDVCRILEGSLKDQHLTTLSKSYMLNHRQASEYPKMLLQAELRSLLSGRITLATLQLAMLHLLQPFAPLATCFPELS